MINYFLKNIDFLIRKSFFIFILILFFDSGSKNGYLIYFLIGLMPFLLLSFFSKFNFYLKYNILNIFVYLSIIVFLFYVLFFGVVQHLSINTLLKYNSYLLIVPFLLIYLVAIDLKSFLHSFVFAGKIILLIFFLLQFLLYSLGGSSDLLLLFLNANFNGFFRSENLLGIDYFIIYFQSTLIFTIFSFIFYYRKKYFLYFLSLLFLLAATSRFGFIVSLFFPILLYLFDVKKVSRYSIYLYFLFSVISLFIYFFISFFVHDYISNADITNYSSSQARVVNLLSTIESFNNLIDYIFGQGAGSNFYSQRCNCLVDNTELSQLEHFRRYGVIGYFIHVSIWCFMLIINHYYRLYIFNVLVFLMFLISFSNPVYTSIFNSIFISISFVNWKPLNIRKINE